MFSMLPTPAHTHLQSHHYTPAVSSPLSSSPLRSSPTPSPLSPRDSNILSPTRDYDLMMSPTHTPKLSSKPAQTPSNSTSSSRTTRSSSRESTFSKRATKPNPLLHKSDSEGRETRRKLFLKKVKEGSEDKRWKARGGDEEMLRTIWIMEERRRVQRQREIFGEVQGEEEYLSLDELMAEEVEGEEERELNAILAGLEQEQQQPLGEEMDSEGHDLPALRDVQSVAYRATETPYGSDDDEFDSLFMDVIEAESRQASQQQPSKAAGEEDQDMMDMS